MCLPHNFVVQLRRFIFHVSASFVAHHEIQKSLYLRHITTGKPKRLCLQMVHLFILERGSKPEANSNVLLLVSKF